jgi:type II secretory pathway component PulF
VLVPPLIEIFDDFGIDLPPTTMALVWLRGPGRWLVLGLLVVLFVVPLVLRLLAPTFAASWLLARLPLLGTLWRSRSLVGFCNLLSTLLDQSIPLPAALQLTADGLGDGELKAASRQAAKETAAGQSLSQCMAAQPAFPRTLWPIVHWGEQLSAQSEALRSAANLYRKRMESQIELLSVVIPPVTFVFVAATTWLVLIAVLFPLIRLVTALSG